MRRRWSSRAPVRGWGGGSGAHRPGRWHRVPAGRAEERTLLRRAHAGFSPDEREVVRSWATKLGAAYSGDLVCGATTHLVCRRLLDACTGPKYKSALAWGIPVLSFRWLHDSAVQGRWLPHADFKADCCAAGPAESALRQKARRPPLAQLHGNTGRRGEAGAAAADVASKPLALLPAPRAGAQAPGGVAAASAAAAAACGGDGARASKRKQPAGASPPAAGCAARAAAPQRSGAVAAAPEPAGFSFAVPPQLGQASPQLNACVAPARTAAAAGAAVWREQQLQPHEAVQCGQRQAQQQADEAWDEEDLVIPGTQVPARKGGGGAVWWKVCCIGVHARARAHTHSMSAGVFGGGARLHGSGREFLWGEPVPRVV